MERFIERLPSKDMNRLFDPIEKDGHVVTLRTSYLNAEDEHKNYDIACSCGWRFEISQAHVSPSKFLSTIREYLKLYTTEELLSSPTTLCGDLTDGLILALRHVAYDNSVEKSIDAAISQVNDAIMVALGSNLEEKVISLYSELSRLYEKKANDALYRIVLSYETLTPHVFNEAARAAYVTACALVQLNES